MSCFYQNQRKSYTIYGMVLPHNRLIWLIELCVLLNGQAGKGAVGAWLVKCECLVLSANGAKQVHVAIWLHIL